MNRTLQIGQVAAQAGVNVQTLRFYERRGLLKAPARRASGYRQYTHDAVVRVRFIKRAQALGFSLKEVDELLALRAMPRGNCAGVKDAAERKLADVHDKIRQLQGVQRALEQIVKSCGKAVGPCSLLEALSDPRRQESWHA